jgi:alpha-1,3-mannosyltransferase
VVLFQARGFAGTFDSLIIILFVQIGLPGMYFFNSGEQALSYYRSAFDFSRQFLYKWTVNWRFVSEERFLSPGFAKLLLVGHLAVLVAFGLFRWNPFPGGTGAVLARGLKNPRALFRPAVPEGIMSSERESPTGSTADIQTSHWSSSPPTSSA